MRLLETHRVMTGPSRQKTTIAWRLGVSDGSHQFLKNAIPCLFNPVENGRSQRIQLLKTPQSPAPRLE